MLELTITPMATKSTHPKTTFVINITTYKGDDALASCHGAEPFDFSLTIFKHPTDPRETFTRIKQGIIRYLRSHNKSPFHYALYLYGYAIVGPLKKCVLTPISITDKTLVLLETASTVWYRLVSKEKVRKQLDREARQKMIREDNGALATVLRQIIYVAHKTAKISLKQWMYIMFHCPSSYDFISWVQNQNPETELSMDIYEQEAGKMHKLIATATDPTRAYYYWRDGLNGEWIDLPQKLGMEIMYVLCQS